MKANQRTTEILLKIQTRAIVTTEESDESKREALLAVTKFCECPRSLSEFGAENGIYRKATHIQSMRCCVLVTFQQLYVTLMCQYSGKPLCNGISGISTAHSDAPLLF